MFEVGREYRFVARREGAEGSWVGEVIEVRGTLIRVAGPLGETVLDTDAESFQGATLLPYRSPEEKAAAEAEWQKIIGR